MSMPMSFRGLLLASLGVVALYYMSAGRGGNLSSSNINDLSNNYKGEYQVTIRKATGNSCILETTDGQYIEVYTKSSGKTCVDNLNMEGLATVSKSGRNYTLHSFNPVSRNDSSPSSSNTGSSTNNTVILEYQRIQRGPYYFYISPAENILLGRVVSRDGHLLTLDTTNENTSFELSRYYSIGFFENVNGKCAFGDLTNTVMELSPCPTNYDPNVHSVFNSNNLSVP